MPHSRQEVKRLSALLSPPFCDRVKVIECRHKTDKLFTAMSAFVVVPLVNFNSVLVDIVEVGLRLGRGGWQDLFCEFSASPFLKTSISSGNSRQYRECLRSLVHLPDGLHQSWRGYREHREQD